MCFENRRWRVVSFKINTNSLYYYNNGDHSLWDKEGYNILVLFLKTSSCLILLEGEFLVYKQMAYTVALNISIIKNT